MRPSTARRSVSLVLLLLVGAGGAVLGQDSHARARSASPFPSAFAPNGNATALGGLSRRSLPTPACEPSITDQAIPANCLMASTTPTLGMLYPISSDLFVSPGGSVGIGTTNPTARLHVTSSGTTTIQADATATSGVTYAAQFENSSVSGTGVFGIASATSGLNYGAYFVSSSPNGTGVRGETLSSSSTGVGVYGQSAGPGGFGVYGVATNTSGTNYGVVGTSAGAVGIGVAASATDTVGTNYAVWGSTSSPNGYAGYFTGGRNYFQGSVGIGQANPAHPLDLASGAHCTSGGVWTNASSRKLKENFVPVDVQDVLARVDELPIERWNYKAEGEAVRHVGPMAEDFARAFDLGGDSESIGTVDADGVALAAIQGLHGIVCEQRLLIRRQEERILRQQETVDALLRRVEALERGRDR